MKRFITPILGMAALATAVSALAAESTLKLSDLNSSVVAPSKTQDLHIVMLRSQSLMEYNGGISGMKATKPATGKKIDPESENVERYSQYLENLHERILTSVGSNTKDKVYTYRFAANGFAANLTHDQVEQLRANSEVVAVYKNEILKTQSNSSHKFIGLTDEGGAWLRGYTGEDVVIGVLDTGVNPENLAFADVPTPANGATGDLIPYGPVPASFTGSGCEFGNNEFNENDGDFTCNNKLIKADYFVQGWGEDNLATTEFLSARDSDGHGSHTASTAAGNYGVAADINGEFRGDITGMAPRARVAVYKVCWQSDVDGPDQDDDPDAGCASADSMAAIDQAVADGVDVINFSIGGSSTSFGGPDDLAFLRAADAGVWVATSQGNSGPGAGTTGTPSGVPWITAVGAAQDDQLFGTGLEVSAPTSVADTFAALEGGGAVSIEDTGTISSDVVPVLPADGCAAITNTAAVDGEIALVIRGGCGFLDKYNNAAAAGASAIVVYNDGTSPTRIDPISMGGFDGSETIPGVMIGFNDGDAIAAAHAAGDAVTGLLSPEISIPQVDRIAGFSSRGPNGGAPDIIKPDIAAPGVEILAAGSAQPNAHARSGNFAVLSGTSMASPHVAGLFALLKQAHPDWSPAMARSAIMTTARQNLRKTFQDRAADPFDIGAGAVVPNKMFEPGLVYDAGLPDYLAFTCENNVMLTSIEVCAALEFAGYSKDASNLNLPSIAVADLLGYQIVRRTVTSVAKGTNTFTASFDAPQGIEMLIWPDTITLREGESAEFQVLFQVTEDAVMNEWAFGSIQWSWDDGVVRSPAAVRPLLLSTPSSLDETGTDGSASFDALIGYDGSFNVAMNGMVESVVSANEIEDGDRNQSDVFVIPEGVTLARFSMFDSEVGDGSTSDDMDIRVFGPDTAGFPLQGSSAGGTSQESVEIANPAPGVYIVVVDDFASAEGPTTYAVHNFNLTGGDSGAATVTTTNSATSGTFNNVNISWSDLTPGSRYLGIMTYSDGATPLNGSTEVMINTQ